MNRPLQAGLSITVCGPGAGMFEQKRLPRIRVSSEAAAEFREGRKAGTVVLPPSRAERRLAMRNVFAAKRDRLLRLETRLLEAYRARQRSVARPYTKPKIKPVYINKIYPPYVYGHRPYTESDDSWFPGHCVADVNFESIIETNFAIDFLEDDPGRREYLLP